MPGPLSLSETATVAGAFLAMPSCAFIVDWEGKVVLANRMARNTYFRREGSTRLNLHLSEVFDIPQDTATKTIRGALKVGRVTLSSRRMSSHRPKPIRFRATLISGARSGERSILLAQDTLGESVEAITNINNHRRRVEARLEAERAGNRELTSSLHTMEVFTNAASHDLRNPISVLRGLIDHMQEDHADALPQDGREVLNVMSRAAAQMDEITTQLLEHARSATGTLATVPIDAHHHIDNVFANLAPIVEDAGGRVEAHGPAVTLLADPALFEVLVTNLVSNAIKYRDADRPPVVKVALYERTSMVVSDNGIGFSPEDATRIFGTFERLSHSSDRGGTGLGLATCFEICRRHGWSISASGEPGVGASFTVTFAEKDGD